MPRFGEKRKRSSTPSTSKWGIHQGHQGQKIQRQTRFKGQRQGADVDVLRPQNQDQRPNQHQPVRIVNLFSFPSSLRPLTAAVWNVEGQFQGQVKCTKDNSSPSCSSLFQMYSYFVVTTALLGTSSDVHPLLLRPDKRLILDFPWCCSGKRSTCWSRSEWERSWMWKTSGRCRTTKREKLSKEEGRNYTRNNRRQKDCSGFVLNF